MKVNISIDDVSPHPLSSTNVVDQCQKIIDEFPEVKISLFVPMSYWRTMRPKVSTESPLQIDLFPEFCKNIKNLNSKNYEICYHGFYHGIPGKSDNDELRDISYENAVNLINCMREVAKRSGLENTFKDILRPPAWRMSSECFDACKDTGIKLLALTDHKHPDGSLDYKGKDIEFGDVTYANMWPPTKPLTNNVEKACIVYHACEWDGNYLNDNHCNELINFLKENADEIEFCFMEEMIDGQV